VVVGGGAFLMAKGHDQRAAPVEERMSFYLDLARRVEQGFFGNCAIRGQNACYAASSLLRFVLAEAGIESETRLVRLEFASPLDPDPHPESCLAVYPHGILVSEDGYLIDPTFFGQVAHVLNEVVATPAEVVHGPMVVPPGWEYGTPIGSGQLNHVLSWFLYEPMESGPFDPFVLPTAFSDEDLRALAEQLARGGKIVTGDWLRLSPDIGTAALLALNPDADYVPLGSSE
jgi:hypothetical protein